MRTHIKRSRRGVAIVYTVFVIACLCLVLSFAVDFVGLNSITAKNNTTAGYNPSVGTASLVAASIASNGPINFEQNPSINGKVILGPDGTYSETSPVPLRLPNNLAFPATEAAPA